MPLPIARVAALVAALVASAPDLSAATAPTDPLDVTREFYRAIHAGDARAAAKLTAGANTEPVLRSFVQISRSYRTLEEALAKRFGPEAAGEVGYGRKVQEEIKGLLGATVLIDGDTARVDAVDGTTITTLRRVRGAWRVEMEEALQTPEGLATFAAHARATEGAAKAVVKEIRAGKYPTPRDAIEDFDKRVARAAGGVRGGEPPQRGAPEPEGTPL